MRWRKSVHSAAVKSLALAPGGKTLASGGADDRIRTWRASDGRLLRSLKKNRSFGSTLAIGALAFSQNGAILYSGDNDDILCWSAGSGRLLAEGDGLYGRVLTLALDPKSRLLATEHQVHGSGNLFLWRLNQHQMFDRIPMK